MQSSLHLCWEEGFGKWIHLSFFLLNVFASESSLYFEAVCIFHGTLHGPLRIRSERCDEVLPWGLKWYSGEQVFRVSGVAQVLELSSASWVTEASGFPLCIFVFCLYYAESLKYRAQGRGPSCSGFRSESCFSCFVCYSIWGRGLKKSVLVSNIQSYSVKTYIKDGKGQTHFGFPLGSRKRNFGLLHRYNYIICIYVK